MEKKGKEKRNNKGIGKITAVSITCKDCGAVFVMGRKEINWYSTKMGFPLPKRCKDCRKKRKEAAESQN